MMTATDATRRRRKVSHHNDVEDFDSFFMAKSPDDDETRQSVNNVYVESEPNNANELVRDCQESKSCASSKRETFEKASDDESFDFESDYDIKIIEQTRTTKVSKVDRRSCRKRQSTINVSPEILDLSEHLSSKTKRQKTVSAIAQYLEPDENEEFFKQILKETSRTPTIFKETTPETPRRVYNVIFKSKLDGTINKAIRIKVLGKYDFASIAKSVLDGFVREYDIPSIMKKIYTVDNITLFWNGAKLLNFMTCNCLKIPQASENEVNDVEVTIVSKEHEAAFEKEQRSKLMKEEEAIPKYGLSKDEHAASSVQTTETDQAIEMYEKELENSFGNEFVALKEDQGTNHLISIDLDEEEDHEVVRLALVGQDNKRMYVDVRKSTTFSKIMKHYKSHKQIAKGAKLKLIFDNEELPLNETVASRDMEDDDLVEVAV